MSYVKLQSSLSAAMRADQDGTFRIPPLQALKSRLLASASTWEIVTSRQYPRPDDLNGLVLARTNDGTYYVSTPDLGIPELKVGTWIRQRLRNGLESLPVIRGMLRPKQYDSAVLCCNGPVSVLTGGPGTGKTTSAKAIFDAYVRSGRIVALCAFMGSAASRLGAVLEAPATTIHRLLGYSPRGFEYNEQNKLDWIDVVIVDESGTPGIVLIMNLINALRDDCVIIFVGDENQLSSIEPGNVLADLCQSVPTARLLDVIRTDFDGPIGLAAQSIRNGIVPDSAERGQNGFFFLETSDEHIVERSFRIRNELSIRAEEPIENIRSMFPTNKLVASFNSICFDSISPGEIVPIICRTNNINVGIFNGDFGILKPPYETGLFKKFGQSIEVDFNDENLDLHKAFGTTVNVMQGKECRAAQVAMPAMGCGTPRRSEFYTAITRPSDIVVAHGSYWRMEQMVRNKLERPRVTLLPQFIAGNVEVRNEGNNRTKGVQ